ncbi:phospholipase A [Marinobacter sp. Arc7-DN-1]|uniref:phospholipase A n=1 Tax=Marinobacter sp. Arc7-DN-1 TaxID=2304594 RepID=UPI000E44D000|nr:phospholipase A [Marinobacter sp. Arc7-DN-1]AXS84174.1 phospholipase [Marinobacter sp. Arc7-DN-1]
MTPFRASFASHPFILAFVLAPGAVQAEPTLENPIDSPEQCALIEDGIQRLACFDSIFEPEKQQAQATEAQKEEVRRRVDNLAPDDEALKQVGGNALEDDSDTGVMSALVDRYVAAEKAIFSFSGSFVGHRPTYILPVTWVEKPNSTPSSPRLGSVGYDYELAREEAKYQISFKVPLLTGLLDNRTTMWFGYTQQSYWQVYNQDDSAPFRETNYEPEIFVRYQADWDIGPGRLNGVTLGFNHQSNGQSEPRSRSWNRIMANAAYSYGRWLFMVQPWYRIPENSNDDNADIERYLGHANYQAVYKLTADRTFSLRLMNNLRSDDNKTSVEFGYSFPMGDTVKGFFQYYNGYGESLIDYNHRIQRFGIGIMLNDWL